MNNLVKRCRFISIYISSCHFMFFFSSSLLRSSLLWFLLFPASFLWFLNLCHGVKKCRPFPRAIARIHLAITSMFVCMNASCRFVQDALPKTCSSFCRHAEFKFMFDLKISLITRANSLKIIQTTEIHYWPLT